MEIEKMAALFASRDFTGSAADQVEAFARDQGCEAVPMAGRTFHSRHRPVEGYATRAVARGGARLLWRSGPCEEPWDTSPPWIIQVPDEQGGVRMWRIRPLETDLPPAALVILIGLVGLGLLVLAGVVVVSAVRAGWLPW